MTGDLGEMALTALVGVVVTGMAGGLVALIKMLSRVARDVAALGPSMQALYQIQPHIIRATRHQNAALKELGANGSTVKSDECLDAAESCLDRRLVERVGGCS